MTERDRFVAGMLSRVGGKYCTYPNFRDDCADCSTTIAQEFFKATGRTLTGSSYAQAALGVSVGENWHAWEPGDILVYLNGGHTGVYVGDGWAVHAMNEGDGVIKSRVDSDYWLRNFVDARRLQWRDDPSPKVRRPRRPRRRKRGGRL